MQTSQSMYEVSKWKALLFATIGGILLILNGMLFHQNRELKSFPGKFDHSLELSSGTLLPPLGGVDLYGNKLTLSYGVESKKTLLFVFSPGCRACRENMPNWAAIADQIDKNSYRLAAVSLSLEEVNDYLTQYKLENIPTITEVEAKDRVAYKFMLTPQTILIDASGKVEKVWSGALQGILRQDSEQTLKVTLPTL